MRAAGVYLYQNWAPLQRPASTLAKALRDGPLWSAFGIRIAVRPRLLLIVTQSTLACGRWLIVSLMKSCPKVLHHS